MVDWIVVPYTTKVHTIYALKTSFLLLLAAVFSANVAAMPLLAVSVAGVRTHTSLALINPSLGSILVTITGRGGEVAVCCHLSHLAALLTAHTAHSISRHIFIILTLPLASERATLPPSYLSPRRHPAI